MSIDAQKAWVLCEQRRFDLAVPEFRRALALDPEAADLHRGLGLCLLATKQGAEAREHARRAVGLAPDDPAGHLLVARVALATEQLKDVMPAVQAARALDPQDPELHYLEASYWSERRQWAKALAAAEAGLRSDPEHDGCALLRAQALRLQGRHEDAEGNVGQILARDPENSDAHANRGWSLLQRGRSREAREAFAEALRLEPTSEWARNGLIEAIKSTSGIYRRIFAAILWLASMPPGRIVMVLVASIVLRMVALKIGEGAPALMMPALLLVWGCFGLFIAMSILIPLGNLALLLHPLGRQALLPAERRQALWVGLGAAVCLVAGGLALAELGPFWADVPILCLLALLPLVAASTPGLVAGSRMLLVGLTLATYLGIAVHAHDVVMRERYRIAITAHLAVLGIGDPAQLSSDLRIETLQEAAAMHAILDLAERGKPIRDRHGWLAPLLFYGLIAFSWFGSALTRFRPGAERS